MKIPETGRSKDELIAEMKQRKRADADWRGGKTWSLIYPAGEDIDEVLREANNLYLFENALNPFRFPSLREMESDVVSMAATMLNGSPGAGGAMTSGGTESIILAVKTARNRARENKGLDKTELLAPVSAHPAFAKAAELLDMELKQVPLDKDLRCDVAAAAALINDNTALLVGSAPNYPHGIIDPIPELAGLAAEHDISFHTDACVGGFLLPFVEKLGYEVPPFDFRVPGVTTMSADIHKYGYCTKGASVVLHADQSNLRFQSFYYDRWPGGVYGSMAMAGARPAAPIAAAWAVMNYLGEQGYMKQAQRLKQTAQQIREGIESIPELHIWGDPFISVMAFGSQSIDIMAVGDVMDDKGWHLDRQSGPNALHMMISPNHDRVAGRFLQDLREAVKAHGKSKGKEARYS